MSTARDAPGDAPGADEELASGRTARVYDRGDGSIVKLFEPWMPAGAIDREAHAARVLTEAGVPAPALLGEVVVDGRRGLVFERLEGDTMIVGMRRAPWSIRSHARRLARLHGTIAGYRLPALDRTRDRLRGDISAADGVPPDVRDAALEALEALPDGEALLHGDFHPDNVMLTPRGPMAIDWIAATRGDPAADVARTLLLMAVGKLPEGRPLDALMIRLARGVAVGAYRRERLRAGDVAAEDVARWLLPVAVARFREGITTDGPRLLELARSSDVRAALAGLR